MSVVTFDYCCLAASTAFDGSRHLGSLRSRRGRAHDSDVRASGTDVYSPAAAAAGLPLLPSKSGALSGRETNQIRPGNDDFREVNPSATRTWCTGSWRKDLFENRHCLAAY